MIGFIHPIAVIQISILIIWIVTFLSGTGLYFSTRFKHTTTAVIMNFALATVIWAIGPMLLGLFGVITRTGDIVEAYMDTHPYVHAMVVMEATVIRGSSFSRINRYNWIGFRNIDVVKSTAWMFVCMLVYIFIGFIFAYCAKRRLRRNIF
jgi:hypothetical protein